MKQVDYSDLVKTIEEIKATDTDELFSQAVNNFTTMISYDYKKTAFVMFQEVVERKPDYRSPDGENAYYYLGKFGLNYLNEMEWAIEQFTKALKVDSNDSESLYNRGLCWMNLENWQNALNDFNGALNLVGGNESELLGIEEAIEVAKNKMAEATG